MKRTAAERDLSHLGPGALLALIDVGNRSARPCFFIHGNEDLVIPVEHSKRLVAASKKPTDELWILSGRRHTESVRLQAKRCELWEVSPIGEEYLKRVVPFFGKAAQ